jgi:hypothetical protein
MKFNPRALVVTVTFVAVLAAALSGKVWGAVAISAALVVEVILWSGIFGFLRGARHSRTGIDS